MEGFWDGYSIYSVKNCFAILIRVSKFVSVEKFTFLPSYGTYTSTVKAQTHKKLVIHGQAQAQGQN